MTDYWNGEPYDDDNRSWDTFDNDHNMIEEMENMADTNREPRQRDLSGNIIDGAYADGHTEISSVPRTVHGGVDFDLAFAALEGLRRIDEVDKHNRSIPQVTSSDYNLVTAGMVRSLLNKLRKLGL